LLGLIDKVRRRGAYLQSKLEYGPPVAARRE
jgi:hypothetical protein